MILVGDFLQWHCHLVNIGDLGRYAFTSSYWPNHSVLSDKVVRQDYETLIKCMKSFSLEEVKFENISYINPLSRPLPTYHDTVNLFVTYAFVDIFNRDCVLSIEEIYILYN